MRIQRIKIREWLKNEGGVYDDEDLSYVGLDGRFDLEELAELIKEKTIEECIGCVPIEKIHQLPDDVGSLHETEHDRGWNDCCQQTLKALQDLKNR